MFGKLIKNELKTGLHSIIGIYIVALVAAGFMLLTMFFDNDVSKTIGALLSIALFIIAIIAFVIIVVSTIVNYNKSMYGQQGYLTFSLPVKARTLYLSKMASSFFWVFLGYLFIIGSVLLMFWYVKKNFIDTAEFAEIIDALLAIKEQTTVKGIIISVVARVVIFCIPVFFFITMLMFSLSLGNTRTFQKRSILMACVFALAILVVVIIINVKVVNRYFGVYLITNVGDIYFSLEESTKVSTINLSGTIFQTLMIIGLSIGNIFLIKKKVSVK